MAIGGIARVSQVQLLQPFVTFALAAYFNDETITPQILLFAAAVVATVAISTRTPASSGRLNQSVTPASREAREPESARFRVRIFDASRNNGPTFVTSPRAQRHAARHPDAEHIDPAFVKIEQMRIQQRGEDILHDDHQPDPDRQTVAAKQQQMDQPHRIERDDTDHAPLHRHVQGLIVRIGDDFGMDANLADRGLLKQAARGSGTVSDHRRVTTTQRFLPELQP